MLKHDLQGERRAQRGVAAQQRRGAQQRGAVQVRCYSVRGDGECYLAAVFSETPLHTAASMGYSQCVQLLLKFGAGIEILMGTMKMSALHLAAQEGKRNINYFRERYFLILQFVLRFVLRNFLILQFVDILDSRFI